MGYWKIMQILHFSKKIVPFLKTEAQPASETLCLSAFKYFLGDGQGPREEYCICMLYTIVSTV